ncbi:MAG: RagB/SusD family nutrient uptake outer membrane protein [Tannerellaceae bacterium]|nr:RagB/SusD family nutrient uptake outer membrane protein [Tannerellaceae bacterium]MCD8263058.1 RagB/SusD family nutrient uptake outer membrane protein [Tannerellaceae bacterium]
MILNKRYTKSSFTGWSLLITVLLLFAACESNVLDMDPVNKIPSDVAYSTAERCELAVVGAYNAAQNSRYNGDYSRGYPFGAASIEQSEMRGQDMINVESFFDITYSGTYTAASANNMYMWEASFEAIARYNAVLHGIEQAFNNGVLTQTVYDQYRGELYFLRALTYHNLMIHFALPYNIKGGNNDYGLPIYKEAITSVEDTEAALEIGRSTVEETYKFILEDLDNAEAFITTNNTIIRATAGAAIALKTRVYLHMRDWENVIAEAKKLENYDYALEATPDIPFINDDSNSESIFSISNSTTNNPGTNGSLASMLSADGRRLVMTSPILYNSTMWLEDDKRRDMLKYYETYQGYFSNKYTDVSTWSDNAPIIRYAEVILNYAEAALRSGDASTALHLLNQIRDRALANPATQSYTSADFATNADLLNAILWERRIEFNAEGRRWEDIHRLTLDDIFPSEGIPAKITFSSINAKGAFGYGLPIQEEWLGIPFYEYTNYRFLWPIPNNDLATNPLLASQQNRD